MLSVSSTFLATLRAPHTLAISATLYPDGYTGVATPVDLSGVIAAGSSVVIDRTATNRRQLTLVLADLSLYPASPTDNLNVYGAEIVVKRGIQYTDSAAELVQLGRFRVDQLDRSLPVGPITVTGWDRSMQVADTRFTQPKKYTSQTALSLITSLIQDVYSGLTIHDNSGGPATSTTIPPHVVAQDRWAEVQRVCTLIGCDGYFTELGEFNIAPVPDPTSASPVWTVDAGATGVFVTATDTLTREGAPNGIVATGNSTIHGDSPAYALVTDNVTGSPTKWGGTYGKVPMFYTSPHIRNNTQATTVATALLNDHLGATKTISLDSVPNPALDAGDAVTVNYPDGSSELHIIDVVTIPIDASSTMTLETRAGNWGGT